MTASIVRFVFLFLLTGGAAAQEASPHAIDIPPWFATTFLDFREDIADAAKDGRRLLAYFGQDGCPYCTKLMVTNFSQRAIVDKTRKHFMAVALNMWGDREVTWLDGKATTEKQLARDINVQFTPTILFFDEKGQIVVRLNGYYPPREFEAVLDYVAGHQEQGMTLSEYLQQSAARERPNPALHEESFFLPQPYDLRRLPGGKPLAVIFETTDCAACDELHREGLRRPEVRALIARFDVARFALGAQTRLTAPAGFTTTAHAWASDLGVVYSPSIVFFDANATEVFRIDAYLRPFHLASSFDYVASGAYRSEPSFQRYIKARADRARQRGERVDLWE